MDKQELQKEFFQLRDKIIETQYCNLNNEQREAVLSVGGPVLILAGAGSGKTTVLVNRIANMLRFGNSYKSSFMPETVTENTIEELKQWLYNKKHSNHVPEILENHSILPYQILAITFTNKAANEMKNRVKALVMEKSDNMWILTFHACCVRILRREIDKIGFNKNFTIYDSYDQKSLIKQCMKELDINDRDFTEKEIINKISAQKDELISPEQFKRMNEKNYRENKIADVYLLYQRKLKNNNALDFDDIIVKTVELFKKNSDVLGFYQRKFKYIMVDEYQDTNKAQYELIRMLSESHGNLCTVGDDDQCIYQWRGADIRNILNFEKDFQGTKVIKLEQNYRSKGNILSAANEVIKNNYGRKEKVLRTEAEDGEKIRIYRAYNDVEEGEFIAEQVVKLRKEQEKDLKDFAILYRTNAQSRIFEDAFRKRNIPYRIVGGTKFYDRMEIKDIMAYLKTINNPLDDVSLRRIINVPKRSIGDTTVSKIQNYAEEMDESLFNSLLDVENIPGLSARNINSISKFNELIHSFISVKDYMEVSKLIELILKDTSYLKELEDSKNPEDASRVENLKELVSAAADFEEESEDKTLGAFLEKVTLVSDIDNYDETSDAVVMMTLHSAKGLEFPVVFMAGMENGIFPGMASFNNEGEMEESRRLCYVGITRAKEILYMTSAGIRRVYGRTTSFEQSDFINEIPKDLKEVVRGKNYNVKYQGLANKVTDYIMNSDEKSFDFASETKDEIQDTRYLCQEEAIPGKKVKHSKFGIGTIINVTKDGSNTKVTIAFENMGIKNLLLDMAKLEAV